MRTLSHEEAKAFYDWLGARQDSQGIYEDAALTELVTQGEFHKAQAIFEFGCGTGRFADRLLSGHLASNCRYTAVDISTTMVRLAQERLSRWGRRVEITQSSGSMIVDAQDSSFDRFLILYVLDLLSEQDIRDLLAEAHRVLEPNGLLCTVALTHGESMPARITARVWCWLFRLHPKLVGGCRPILVKGFLRDPAWSLRHYKLVTRFWISSEVLVAARNGHSLAASRPTP